MFATKTIPPTHPMTLVSFCPSRLCTLASLGLGDAYIITWVLFEKHCVRKKNGQKKGVEEGVE